MSELECVIDVNGSSVSVFVCVNVSVYQLKRKEEVLDSTEDTVHRERESKISFAKSTW